MVVLHTFDLILFIARISLVCYDLSKIIFDTIPFLISILILELIGSFSLILCNLLYIILRHYVVLSIDDHPSLKYLWPIATLTCIGVRCHQDSPQSILLTRLLLLGCSFLLKFVCFIIGICCAVRFNPECTAYTVVAAFSLLLFFLIGNIEFVHIRRLSNYDPTQTRNIDESNKVHLDDVNETRLKTTHQRHLAFVPYSLLNDQKCEKGNDCRSESLYHYLLSHCHISERTFPLELFNTKVNQAFIAFYRTSKDEALSIAQKGFPYGVSDTVHQDRYPLRLKKSIYFTLTYPDDLESSEAIMRRPASCRWNSRRASTWRSI